MSRLEIDEVGYDVAHMRVRRELSMVQLMRTGHVKRWHIVRVAREQTIAEHMYRVWLIVTRAMALGLCSDEDVQRSAISWALVHDVPEVVVGDLPTPAKMMIRGASSGDPITDIELSLDDSYTELHDYIADNHPEAFRIVRIADLMEAICFLKIEGIGQHARDVRNDLRRMMDEEIIVATASWPGIDWSIFDKIYTELDRHT